MKNQPKRLGWLDFIQWAYQDTFGTTYSSEDKSRLYDEMAKQFFHRNRLATYIGNKILEYFPAQQPRIWERAAGSGIITEHLYQRGLTRIRASDLSESQLLVLKEKMEDIEIAIEDFNELVPDVNDRSVDVIFQVGATRFMSQQGQINYIIEAARTLKDGGIVIWPIMWAEVPLAWFRKGKGPRTLSWNIARLLRQNGFEIVEAPIVWHGRMLLLTSRLMIARKTAEDGRTSSSKKSKKWLYLDSSYVSSP